jgi:hypothetical protein
MKLKLKKKYIYLLKKVKKFNFFATNFFFKKSYLSLSTDYTYKILVNDR